MIKKILFAVFITIPLLSVGQTVKTDVLVIGGGAAGTAAGIQAARSGVKTMIVESGPWLGGSMTAGGNCIVEANRNLPAGIYGEFRKHVRAFYRNEPGYDTTQNAALRFEPYTGAAILKKITDTVKRLTVKLNTPWTNIKKDGDGWLVTIREKNENLLVHALVVIDGTETGDVAARTGAVFDMGFDSSKNTGEALAPEKAIDQIQQVTWIAVLKDYGRAADRTIDKPEDYQPSLYAGLKGKDIKKMLADARLPNDKYMIKWAQCSSPTTSEDLEPENREEFYKKGRLRTLGLIYYLQTELGFKNLAPDFQEFNTADHLPMIPYIREDKRAQGQIRMVADDIFIPYDRASKLYRTSIGVGDAMPGQHYEAGSKAVAIHYPPFPGYSIPMGSVVLHDIDNLLVTEKALSATHLVNASTFYPSVQMILGQGVGTVAAYCAFFKTTTKKLNVRKIQTEILDYKGYLMPFADESWADPYFRAIQQVGATGMLRGVQKNIGNAQAAVYFMPDSLVKTSEIKPVMMEIYSRAFIWFNKNKPGELFTIGNLLSFISEMTLADPATLQLNMEKLWKSKYKFTAGFDMNKPVTRREFAILANQYVNPFAREVDITGKLIN